MDVQTKGLRLDQYVVSQLPGISRAFAEKLIEQGRVHINGQPVLKSGYRIKQSDVIIIDYKVDLTKQAALKLKLPILYEDKSCVVIEKPAGVLTHSKGAFNPEATVADWLKMRYEDRASFEENNRFGIVHRLDRDTSGVMICAKTPEALSWLQKQFSQRKTKKSYYAVVIGTPKPSQAVIDIPIERNPKKPQTFRAGSRGKPAVTAYKVVKYTDRLSLLALTPTTGRTHQLRVHMKHLGHPILGDRLYGSEKANRMYLHAFSLELTLPDKQRKVFESPLPPEFDEIMKK